MSVQDASSLDSAGANVVDLSNQMSSLSGTTNYYINEALHYSFFTHSLILLHPSSSTLLSSLIFLFSSFFPSFVLSSYTLNMGFQQSIVASFDPGNIPPTFPPLPSLPPLCSPPLTFSWLETLANAVQDIIDDATIRRPRRGG